MAKTAAAPAAETADAPKGGGKKKLVMIVVPVLLVVVAAWYFVLGPGSGGSEAEEKPKEPELGEVVALEPITMNIEGGSILKVGLALQLHHDAAEGGGGGHGGEAAADDPHKGYARVLDIAIEVFGKRSYQDLVGSEGREAAKHEFVEALHHAYPEEIEDVYLTEFVMSE
jgi:flagellar FliL protein